jgi:hypothetical protein
MKWLAFVDGGHFDFLDRLRSDLFLSVQDVQKILVIKIRKRSV